MPSNFMIYAYPRTGSYLLTSLLNSADDIVCHGEIFKPNAIELQNWYKQKLDGVTIEGRDADPIGYISRIRRLSPNKHFGFKAFPEHLWRTKIRGKLLNVQKWKKVVLVRDPVEVYASLRRAYETKVWIVNNGEQHDREKLNAPVTFSPETWEPFIENYSGFLNDGATVPNSIIIRYDQLHDASALADVLSFIGSSSPVGSLKAGVKKQFTKASVEDGFANWGAFSDYLAANPAPLLPTIEG